MNQTPVKLMILRNEQNTAAGIGADKKEAITQLPYDRLP